MARSVLLDAAMKPHPDAVDIFLGALETAIQPYCIGAGGPVIPTGLADWRDEERRACITQMAAIRTQFTCPDDRSIAAWAFPIKCRFQAGSGAKGFKTASLSIKVPQGLLFLQVLPEKVQADEGVTITVDQGGSVTAQIQHDPASASTEVRLPVYHVPALVLACRLYISVSGCVSSASGACLQVHHTASTSYAFHSCLLTGAGDGTSEALFQWSEDEHRKAGINTDNMLWLVLPYKSGVESFDVDLKLRAKSKWFRGRTCDHRVSTQLVTTL